MLQDTFQILCGSCVSYGSDDPSCDFDNVVHGVSGRISVYSFRFPVELYLPSDQLKMLQFIWLVVIDPNSDTANIKRK